MTKAKPNKIPIRIKKQIIEMKDKNFKNRDICKKFGLSKSTVCTIYSPKGRERVKAAIKDNVCEDDTRYNKYQKVSLVRDTELVLDEILLRLQNKGCCISKALIQSKAKEISEKLMALGFYDNKGIRKDDSKLTMEIVDSVAGFNEIPIDEPGENRVANESESQGNSNTNAATALPNNPDSETSSDVTTIVQFVASNGWLNRYINRKKLKNMTLYGEAGSSDKDAAKLFVESLSIDMALHYKPTVAVKILINFDESGLQYKSYPSRSYVPIGSKVKGKKQNKQRVTVLFGATMDGHKFKPLVIGKSKNPRVLKNVNRNNLL